MNPGIYLGQLVRSGPQPLRFTEPPLRGFVIHLCIYVIVIAGLASLNLTRNPSRPWFLWVLVGWGIILAAHDVVLLMKSRPERAGPFSAKQASGISEPNPPTLPKHPNATVTVILIAGWSIEREHEIKRQPRRYPDGLQHNRRRSTAARKPLTSTWAARYNKRRKPIMRAEELPPGDRPNANVDD